MDRTVLPKLESWITGIYEIYYWSNGFARANRYIKTMYVANGLALAPTPNSNSYLQNHNQTDKQAGYQRPLRRNSQNPKEEGLILLSEITLRMSIPPGTSFPPRRARKTGLRPRFGTGPGSMPGEGTGSIPGAGPGIGHGSPGPSTGSGPGSGPGTGHGASPGPSIGPGKGPSPRFSLLIASVLLLLISASVIIYPSFQWAERPPGSRPNLVYRGETHKFPVVVENSEAYVPLKFIQSKLDPDVFWDEAGLMVVTTKDKVVKLSKDSLTAYVNQHQVSLQFPVILEGKQPYVPASTLETLYPVSTACNEEAGTFLVRRLDTPNKMGKLNTDSILRVGASFLSKRIELLSVGDRVVIYGEAGRWLKVETSGGFCGFVYKKHVTDMGEEPPVVEDPLRMFLAPCKATRSFWPGNRLTG